MKNLEIKQIILHKLIYFSFLFKTPEKSNIFYFTQIKCQKQTY